MNHICELVNSFMAAYLHELPVILFQGSTGSNLVTVTCANPESYARAEKEPEKFDIFRTRMGGWTNFFIAMFPEHQKQHRRRPLYGPHKET